MTVHPNVRLLETAVTSLGNMVDHFVFIGGSTTTLLITDPASPMARVSVDIDAIVTVDSLAEYHRLGKLLRKQGFVEDTSESAPLCRWRLDDLILDVMPTDKSIIGFSNRWYDHTIATAQRFNLPSGRSIRLATAPCFLATKLEAFHSRGKADYLASEDIEDIITVLDGRPAIIDEIACAAPELLTYLADRMKELHENMDFRQALPGHLEASGGSTGRSELVLQRIQQIMELGE